MSLPASLIAAAADEGSPSPPRTPIALAQTPKAPQPSPNTRTTAPCTCSTDVQRHVAMCSTDASGRASVQMHSPTRRSEDGQPHETPQSACGWTSPHSSATSTVMTRCQHAPSSTPRVEGGACASDTPMSTHASCPSPSTARAAPTWRPSDPAVPSTAYSIRSDLSSRSKRRRATRGACGPRQARSHGASASAQKPALSTLQTPMRA